jgi:hypothetical protein
LLFQPSDGSDRTQQITVGVDGHETTDIDSKDLPTDPPSNGLENLPIDPPTNQEISIKSLEDSAEESSQPQQDIQPIISTQQQPQSSQQQDFRVLIDWDELQDKMAEVHHKDIKSFWLCGRIENGTKKLLNMVLEREQPQQVMA